MTRAGQRQPTVVTVDKVTVEPSMSLMGTIIAVEVRDPSPDTREALSCCLGPVPKTSDSCAGLVSASKSIKSQKVHDKSIGPQLLKRRINKNC